QESSLEDSAGGSLGSMDLSPDSLSSEQCRQIGRPCEPFNAGNSCIGSLHIGQGADSAGELGFVSIMIWGQASDSDEWIDGLLERVN
ncbi:MAG: hypothetical protein V3T55_06045, partial [Anaerolineales bacterium]